MFPSTGSNGLYKAPLSKSLLLVPSALSVLLTLLFQHYQKFFTYNLQAVREDFQIWRLVFGRTVCLDLKDTFCSSLLIYNFRIFERRYGSRKFSLGSCICSVCTIFLLHSKDASDTNIRPVSHHKQDIGLYTGFTARNLWFLHLDCSRKWTEPYNEIRVGMGATVDIQRRQRMELLDRQIMMSQFAQMRRQRQQQGRVINWNQILPPLRRRRNANYQDNGQSEQEAPPTAEVSEEQVARLMEMGFSRVDALEALRASNNDLNVATNFLLQH
ncbi:ubiquitin-associated domain-containing protein 2 isoform X2 [Chelonoidis abingdonii]|uniref:ubiquitin-associated domain-containing protein 2 isoform X2 n=1 Tax=Chelonoidis abingdonii TaxID=106734 RepID=UPI003F494264